MVGWPYLLLLFICVCVEYRSCRHPLHYAAVSKQTEIVKLLLANGADVNARTAAEFTPLHLAMSANCEPIVRVLIAAGAEYVLIFSDSLSSRL